MFLKYWLCLWLVVAGKFALAQNKMVDAYGYRFDVPAKWEVDWDIEPNSVYVTENLPSISDAAMFLLHFYDSTAVKNEKDLRKKVFRAIMHNVGDAYEHTAKTIWDNTKQKNVANNGIAFREYTTQLPTDERGNASWLRIWVACDSSKMDFAIFQALTYKEPKKPEIDREKELTAILKTIRRSDKMLKGEENKPKKNQTADTKKTKMEEKPKPTQDTAPPAAKTARFEDRELKQGESIDFTLTFVADGTDFEGDMKQELKRIVSFLKENPQIEVSIVGYASKINVENRETLGKARAEKVRDALLRAKIDSKRLQCKGSNEGGIDKRVKVVIDRIR